MAQWVKDLGFSTARMRSLLWHGFHSWPGNFHVPKAQPPDKGLSLSGCEHRYEGKIEESFLVNHILES